jgi:hypothetical protein
MGRVVKYLEISGLPKKEDFSKALVKLRSNLKEAKVEGIMKGALVYGSAAAGTANIRSDIDCLVLSIDGHKQRMNRILSNTYNYSLWELNVPIQFIHVTEAEVSGGLHSVSAPTLVHLNLIKNSKCIIGDDPRTYIHPPDTLRASSINYLSFTLNNLNRMSLELKYHRKLEDEQYFKTLQKTLDKPPNTARMLLYCAKKIPKKNGMQADTKPEVCKRYMRLFPKQLGRALRHIMQVDAAYTEMLTRGREISLNVSDYCSMLRKIEETLPHSISFVEKNLKFLLKFTH